MHFLTTDRHFLRTNMKLDFIVPLLMNVFPFFRDQYSCYIDYKYMIEMFKDQPEILKVVNWGAFGFKDRNGADSTLWIGSKNAFTPLHKDTYGMNLVAQLSGKKSWMLFKPEDTENLYPVRIPYEESSVFSNVNMKNPDFIKYPKFKEAKQYEVGK